MEGNSSENLKKGLIVDKRSDISEEAKRELRKIAEQEDIDNEKWKQTLSDLGHETYRELEKMGFDPSQIQKIANLLYNKGISMVLRSAYGLESKNVGQKALHGGMNLMDFARSIEPPQINSPIETQGQT